MTLTKIYYLKQTGEVILHIPENNSEWAKSTTREQDEAIYSPLQSYNPESVDLLELEPGQYASDFVSATSFRVNLDTLELEFEFPVYHPPLTSRIQAEEQKNLILQERVNTLETENADLKLLIADMALGQGGML